MAVYHDIPLRSARNQLLGVLFSTPLVLEKAELLTIAPASPVHAYPLQDLPVIYRPSIILGTESVIFVLGAETGDDVKYILKNVGGDIEGVILGLEQKSTYESFIAHFDDRSGWEIAVTGPPDPSLDSIKKALNDPEVNLGESLSAILQLQWRSVAQFTIPSTTQDATLSILAEKRGIKTQLTAPINLRTEIDVGLEIDVVKLNAPETPLGSEIEPPVKKLTGEISLAEAHAIRIANIQGGVAYKIIEISPVGEQAELALEPLGSGKFSVLYPAAGPIFKVGFNNAALAQGEFPSIAIAEVEGMQESDVLFNFNDPNDPPTLIIQIPKRPNPGDPPTLVSADTVMEKWQDPDQEQGNFSLDLFLNERFSKEDLSKAAPAPPGFLPIPPDTRPEKDARWAVGATRSVDENAPFQEKILTQRLQLSILLNSKVDIDLKVPDDGMAAGGLPDILINTPQKGVDYELYALPLRAGFSFDTSGADYDDRGNLLVNRGGFIPGLPPDPREPVDAPVLVCSFGPEGKLDFSTKASNILEDSLLIIKAKIRDTAVELATKELWLDSPQFVLVKPDAGLAAPPAGNQRPDLEMVGQVRIRLSNAQSGVGYQLREKESGQEIGPILFPRANRLGWEAHGREFGMPVADDGQAFPGDFKFFEEGEDERADLSAPITLEFALPSSLQEGTVYEILAVKEYTGLEQILTNRVEITAGGVPIIVSPPQA